MPDTETTRKKRFEYPKRSTAEWVMEWKKNGIVSEARARKDVPCSLKCGKPIGPSDKHPEYARFYIAANKKYIAHEDCVNTFYKQMTAKQDGERWREQEKLRKEKGIIPMPPEEVAPAAPTGAEEHEEPAEKVLPFKPPGGKKPAVNMPAETASVQTDMVRYLFSAQEQDLRIECFRLMIENAELKGFRQAVEILNGPSKARSS